jgi:hypothetical protein
MVEQVVVEAVVHILAQLGAPVVAMVVVMAE